MKSKLYTFSIFIIVSIVAFSCKTASKLYEKGNYDKAVELAAKKLQKDPNDAKLIAILQNAYRYAINDHEDRIRNFSTSNNELKWEWMYNEYISLQRMYDAIYRTPSVSALINPVNYSSYLATYAEKAGDVRYDRGLTFMNRHDKLSYRNAYREFQAALQFKPGHRDIVNKMNEAYSYAVTNVVIHPMHQYGGYVYSSNNASGNNFSNDLIRDLQYNSGGEFVKFYSSWDIRSNNIRIDFEMDMQLAAVDIGRYYDSRSNRKVSKEVVVKETVYKPDSVVKQYAKIYADIVTTHRKMISNAVMQVNVRDANGRWAWRDDFTAHHNWDTEFVTYTGDERALTDADKQLVNRRREFAPPESEVMRCLLEQIGKDARYRIANYFNRF